jgi:O-antigen/teichoic acid export membrane protein
LRASISSRPVETTPTQRLTRLAEDLSTERLARGARDNLLGILLERVFGLVLLVALPLLLAPAVLGQYYEATALLTMVAFVAMLGLDVGLVRFTALSAEAGHFGEIRAHLRTALAWGGACGVVLAVGLWAAAPFLARWFHAPELSGALRLGTVGVPFLPLAYLLVAPSKGLKRMGDQVLAIQVVQPAVQAVAAIALVSAGHALAGAVGAYAIAAVVAFGVAAALALRLGLPDRTSPPRQPAGTLVRFSVLVSWMALLEMSLLWIDTLLLGAFRPPAEVAVYGLVVRLMTVGIAIMFTVIQIFGPFVAQLLARGERGRLEGALKTVTRWAVLMSAPVLALLAIDGGKILSLLRQGSDAGGRAMTILAAAFLVDALTGPVGHVLTMSGRSGLNAANAAVALAANIGLNLVLIPRWGLTGAAVSWAVVIIGVNVVRMAQVRTLIGIGPLSRSLWRPLAALGTAAGVTLAARAAIPGVGGGTRSLLLDFVLFAAVYLGAIGVRPAPEDRTLFRTLLRGNPGTALMEVAP